MRFSLAISLVLVLVACSSSSKNCSDARCVPGQASCAADNHYRVVCGDDGRQVTASLCGSGTYCSNGECVPGSCLPGRAVCVDQGSYQVCDQLGTGYSQPMPCDAKTQKCVAGLCVPTKCFAGDEHCGVDYKVLCPPSGGDWAKEECGEGQFCVKDGGKATCLPNACTPFQRTCEGIKDSSFVACKFDGSVRSMQTECASGEACVDGVCLPRLCSPVVPIEEVTPDAAGDAAVGDADATQSEADDVQEVQQLDLGETILEAPDKGSVTMAFPDGSSVDVKFSMYLSAKYVVGTGQEGAPAKVLQILMTEMVGMSIYNLEIHLTPLDEGATGHWTQADTAAVQGVIQMNDGTGEPGDPSSWKYNASAYDLQVTEFGAVGGRVKGAFSGTLDAKDGSGAITLSNGVFDIKRGQ